MLEFYTPIYHSVPQHRRSHPCNYGYAANQLLSNFFNTAQLEAQRRSHETPGSLTVKHYEDEDCHQLQFFKRNGDFSSYEISLIRKGGEYVVKISSDADLVEKLFSINKSLIDVDGIDYKWNRESSALVVNLPKRHKHDIRKLAKVEKHREKLLRKQKRKQEKKLKKELKKLQREEKKHEPVPEPEPVSEPDTPETSDFETPSESSDVEDSEPIKHTHSPTMEEVEDEEFVLLRKKFNQ